MFTIIEYLGAVRYGDFTRNDESIREILIEAFKSKSCNRCSRVWRNRLKIMSVYNRCDRHDILPPLLLRVLVVIHALG